MSNDTMTRRLRRRALGARLAIALVALLGVAQPAAADQCGIYFAEMEAARADAICALGNSDIAGYIIADINFIAFSMLYYACA